jgi:hypothetical protein
MSTNIETNTLQNTIDTVMENEKNDLTLREYVTQVENKFWSDSQRDIATVTNTFQTAVYSDAWSEDDEKHQETEPVQLSLDLDATSEEATTQSDSKTDPEYVDTDRDDKEFIDYRRISRAAESTSRFTKLMQERFSREKSWVSESLTTILFGSWLQRRRLLGFLNKRMKYLNMDAKFEISALKADRSYILKDLNTTTGLTPENEHVVTGLLELLVRIYNILDIDEEQVIRAFEKEKKIKKRKGPLLSRRSFLIQAGLLGAGAVAAYSKAPDMVFDEATRENLKLIGTRAIKDGEGLKLPTAYTHIHELFNNNEYSLQNFFSDEQWQEIASALNGFINMFYIQEYSEAEYPKKIDVYTQEFIATIVEASEQYGVPLGINLMLIKIAYEKFAELETYQQEELPTYHAQSLMKTLAAVFKGDSAVTAELVHPLAARFSFDSKNWKSLLGKKADVTFSQSDVTSVLEMPARMASPKLPMKYLEVIRLLLSTLGMHDVEVERYVDGYRLVPAHKEFVDQNEPEYGQACQQLIEARDKITKIREEIYNLIVLFVKGDPDERISAIRFQNNSESNIDLPKKLLEEIGISETQTDSWQYVHFTKVWANAVMVNDDRNVPYNPKLFYERTAFTYEYTDMPSEQFILEQFLNDKLFVLMDKMYLDPNAEEKTRERYLQLKQLRAQHGQLIREVHAKQAVVEQILVAKDTDPNFQLHIGTAFVSTLYQKATDVLGLKIEGQNKYNRDLQGLILFAIATIREISPVQTLTEIDSADSMKSPLIDPVYHERKVIEGLQQFIEEAKKRGLLTEDPSKDFPQFAELLESLINNSSGMIGIDNASPMRSSWGELKDTLFATFAAYPAYGYYDGIYSSEGYKEPSRKNEDIQRNGDPYGGDLPDQFSGKE